MSKGALCATIASHLTNHESIRLQTSSNVGASITLGDSVKEIPEENLHKNEEVLETNTNLPKVGDVKTVRKNGDNKNSVIKK